jgi:VWFA-related protein
MRAVFAVACALALTQGQQPPAFRSGVTLVTVDVTVLDRDGHPVPGLGAADFEIRLNNRAQPIRALDYLQIPDTMAGAVGPSFEAAPVRASPAPTAAKGVSRVFILLVDDVSFSPLTGKELFEAARRFVSSLPAADLVGLTTSTGTVVVNPTADRAPLLAALPRIAGSFQDPRAATQPGSQERQRASGPEQSVGIAQALDIERGDPSALKNAIVVECFGGDGTVFNTQSVEHVLGNNACARTVQMNARQTAAAMKSIVQRQVQSYQGVIRAMAAAPGIRHLVLLTDGVALAQEIDAMQPVARAAAEAGVQLSVLMATPDISLGDAGRPGPQQPGQPRQTDSGAAQRRHEDNQLFLNGARTTADMAGGQFYQITGQPDRFFERVASAASAIYRIAVEAPADAVAGKDFTLSARVLNHAGVTASANRHAIAATPRAAVTAPATAAAARPLVPPDEQVRRAIVSGRTMTGLSVAIDHALRRAADPAQVSIDVVVTLPPSAKEPVSTTFGLVDPSGAIRTSDKKLDAPPDGDGYRLAFSVPVAPGTYKLRFAAADATGAVGAAEAVVEATLKTMGPLQASGISLEQPPGAGRRIVAAIELYPSGGAVPPDVLVRMALVSAASEPIVERVVVPEAIDGALRAEAEFALDRLPPGSYTVRATVVSGTTELGSLSRQIR